jgi:phosphatidylglycerophosphate synthase
LPDKLEHKSSLKYEETPRTIRKRLILAVTALRLALVPLLVFLVSNDLYFLGAALFLFLLATDFLDGFLAREFDVSSKFGTYFDVTTDFILIFSMFLIFNSKGFIPEWVLVLIAFFFAQFIVTSLYWDKIYDPVGKYYGSLLYGAIGLRFILSGQFFYDIATIVITGFTAAAILARVLYLRSSAKSQRAS